MIKLQPARIKLQASGSPAMAAWRIKGWKTYSRLTVFAARIVSHVRNMPMSRAGRHCAGQFLRSCGSLALHCRDSQSAESEKGFVHECKIVLKEFKGPREPAHPTPCGPDA
ncbi:MAG: four helix bundle protein [Flavobacteriales bacterium]|jgi:hypothetical protein|nr:four helix bundle protein [Flavobacteriales bacterium]